MRSQLSVGGCYVLYRQELHLYKVFPWIPQGANLTITCLWRSIKDLVERGVMQRNRIVFLQVDGASDNINQTMFRFLAWLCQKKICRTVSTLSLN